VTLESIRIPDRLSHQQGDKVVIVTRASMGLGQASGKALHQAGFRVFSTGAPSQVSAKEL